MSRERFSDRIGKTSFKQPMQVNEMSVGLKNRLWNFTDTMIRPSEEYRILSSLSEDSYLPEIRFLADKFFKEVVQEISDIRQEKWLRENFLKLTWWEIYNFIELLSEICIENNPSFEIQLNQILEEEFSGYRMLNGKIIPVVDNQEIETIEEAVVTADKFDLSGSREHFKTALSHFSNRPNPDYRNAIKEAISAIESLMNRLAPKHKGSFSKSIESLREPLGLHPALVSSIEKSYGYTSNKEGIRHAMLNDDIEIGFDDAKFMLVSCMALFNFLVSKAVSKGLLSEE